MNQRFLIVDLLTGRQLAQVDFRDDAAALMELFSKRGYIPRLNNAPSAGDTPVPASARTTQGRSH